MAIKIPIVADVEGALRGPEKIADAFEKVQDSLDDVVKDAKRTSDAIEDIGDGTKDAEAASDDMAKKFRDDFDKIRSDSKSTGDGIGKGVKDGTTRAGEGMDNLKGEANDTAREVGASFDGSASSIAEGFQEVAANALAGFGPAGAAAGLAIAAGIGIALSKLTEYAEKVNEAKAAGAEWAQAFNVSSLEEKIEALRDSFTEMSSTIVDDRQWWELWQEDAVTALEAVVNAANRGALDLSEFMKGFESTDPKQRLELLESSLEGVEERLKTLNVERKNTWSPERLGELNEEISALENAKTAIDLQADTQRNANELEAAAAEAIKGTAQEIEEKNEQIEESNDLLEENADANRKAFRSELALADQLADTNKVLKDNDSTNRERKSAVLDAIDAVLESAAAEEEATGSTKDYNRVLGENREQLYEQGRRAGITKEAMDDLIGSTKQVPRKVSTDVTDNGSARRTQARLEGVLETAGIKKDLTIGVRANTATANDDVAQWRHTQASIPVSIGLRAV